MDVSEAKRLRALEDENAKLKRRLADRMLDTVARKDLLGKSGYEPGQKTVRRTLFPAIGLSQSGKR